jgi:hypothetical protein
MHPMGPGSVDPNRRSISSKAILLRRSFSPGALRTELPDRFRRQIYSFIAIAAELVGLAPTTFAMFNLGIKATSAFCSGHSLRLRYANLPPTINSWIPNAQQKQLPKAASDRIL